MAFEAVEALLTTTRRGGRGIELTHTPLFSIFAFLLQTLQLAVATLSYTAATI